VFTASIQGHFLPWAALLFFALVPPDMACNILQHAAGLSSLTREVLSRPMPLHTSLLAHIMFLWHNCWHTSCFFGIIAGTHHVSLASLPAHIMFLWNHCWRLRALVPALVAPCLQDQPPDVWLQVAERCLPWFAAKMREYKTGQPGKIDRQSCWTTPGRALAAAV